MRRIFPAFIALLTLAAAAHAQFFFRQTPTILKDGLEV